MTAAGNGHLDVVALLLKHGVNIHHTDEVSIFSIYMCVCVCVFIDVFPTLISVLFIVCEMNNMSPVHFM